MTCSKCAHKWFFRPAVAEGAKDVPASMPETAPVTQQSAAAAQPQDAPAPSAEIPKEKESFADTMSKVAAITELMEKQNKSADKKEPERAPLSDVSKGVKQESSPLRGWAAFIVLLALLAGAAVIWRAQITSYWPAAEKIYAMAGMPKAVLGAGLAITELSSSPIPPQEGEEFQIDQSQVALQGKIVNLSGEPVTVPFMLFKILDPQGQELHSWVAPPPASRILPHETLPFSTSFAKQADQDVKLLVTFTEKPQDATSPDTQHGQEKEEENSEEAPIHGDTDGMDDDTDPHDAADHH